MQPRALTVPRTIASVRRAYRKRRRRLIRRDAQLRAAYEAQQLNLATALASRDRNAQLALRANDIITESHSFRKAAEAEREASRTERAAMRERASRWLLASLSASLLLLAYAAWSAF